tara:strand:+ start:748 stop:1641 length:894 start_codon:yes stop_codon:yes gene_type:complete
MSANEIVITTPKTHQKTKKLWARTYHELTESNQSVRGGTFIAPLEGNGYKDKLHHSGARNTIIFVPQSVNFEIPIDLIFFFHGLNGFKERDFKTRVLRHTKSLSLTNPNYILIIPEMPWSVNTSTPRKRQGRVFNRKNKFSMFVNSTVAVIVAIFDPSDKRANLCIKKNICHLKFGDVILLGHSAGGSALKSISSTGGMDELYTKFGAKSVKVIFSDAGYGRWTETTWKHFKLKNKTSTEFLLLTRKWDRPYNNTKKFLKKFKRLPKNIRHQVFDRKKMTHGDIGDQALTWTYSLPE